MRLFTKQFKPIGDTGVSTVQVGRLKRQCTHEYKIAPIEKAIKEELLSRGLARRNKVGAILINKSIRVNQRLGISFDEIQRMKPSRTKWIDISWPLIDLRMKRHHCIEWLEARNLPIPGKSSCRICPFRHKLSFREMRDNQPADWQHVCQFDDDLRNGTLRIAATSNGELYLSEDCIPLRQVDLSTPQDHGQLDMCDEGYCFI
jgi:hypothetical protein